MIGLTEDHILLIRRKFADRIEEMVTDPKLAYLEFSLDLPERMRAGQKIPSDNFILGALCRLGQDLRLSCDEIKVLKEKFLILS